MMSDSQFVIYQLFSFLSNNNLRLQTNNILAKSAIKFDAKSFVVVLNRKITNMKYYMFKHELLD